MKRKRVIVLLVAAAVLAATGLYAGWFHRDTALQGSGTVEARNIRVGSKVGGRIDKVLVREGDSVQPGQILITFDDKELQASLEQSRANAEKAKRGYRPEESPKPSRRGPSQGRLRAKEERISQERHCSAQADLDRAKADETRTHLDFDRYEALAKKDLVSRHSLIPPKPIGKWRWRSSKMPGTNSMSCSVVPSRRNRLRRGALPSGSGHTGKARAWQSPGGR